ncbi:MAG TPA: hypothetical protein VGC54_10035 [Planctomycetota bacterium]
MLLIACTLFALTPFGGDPPACDDIAEALRRAEHLEAFADFWTEVAICLNDDDGHDRRACFQAAKAARLEARELADARYQARLDVCALLGHGTYEPDIEPHEFSTTVTNPYWPLVVGRTLTYEGQVADGLEVIVVTTLDETVEVDGFECRVVQDTVTIDGERIEDTRDFYAQRWNGDVWYFGEVVLNYEDGFLDNLHGAWRTGKDDAEAGITMPATVIPGAIFRQEFLIGQAEDVSRMLETGLTVTVPAGTFHDCIKTEEWTPVEPGVFAHKWYAPGVGLIRELELATGEVVELVSIQ